MKRFFVAGVLLLPAVFVSGLAQTTNATLGGTVSDASRAVIPGVTVTATNTQTGIVSTGVTNETGAYNFPSLQPGIYKVSAELPGFQTQVYNEVALGVSQQVRLNFTLQVGGQAQSVEVSVAADTLIATTSASVGVVLPEYKVRDLPLATRNILDLVGTTAGTQGSNFAGGRLTQLNTTRDGIPISDGRYDVGASTSTYVSPDLIDEMRVIVAPADAETGRGSGQIQMSTRSGTNELHGSLFWVNRNSKLSVNSWNNNFQGVDKDYYNGNQFGGRVGGPIIKNKTFFFFLFDGQRYLAKSYFTGAVLTELARQGTFRYFPGVQNGNILTNNPAVDRNGTPIKPANATGDLASFSVFGRNVSGVFTPWDANRAAFDTSGWIRTLVSRMPLPNDYTVGDGMNTAGIRWLRRIEGLDTTNGDSNNTNRNQYDVRIDHNVNASHKAFFTGTWERDWGQTAQAGITNWPGGYNGSVRRRPRVLTGS
ncbi:MAG: carboxypeptidase regulatory-like domain-containing protein, partial [Acidobacteria bacterium]|nr:carboxypeptidase regulatory-like domain-containing protein [Acidobacteriota bacterium]